MTKQELIKGVENVLRSTDQSSSPILVNFFDHEIYWDQIALVVVETITSCFDEVPWDSQ